MKKQKDYQLELAKRKYRKTNWIFYFIYYFASRFIITRPFHPEFKVIDKLSKCKGPAFLIWNHQSRRDHAMLTALAWPRRINFLAEEASFFRSHLSMVFKLNNVTDPVFCIGSDVYNHSCFPVYPNSIILSLSVTV